MTIEKIVWEATPFKTGDGSATLSKCGRYIKGWEWCYPKSARCGFVSFFVIDVVKGIKIGGALTEQKNNG